MVATLQIMLSNLLLIAWRDVGTFPSISMLTLALLMIILCYPAVVISPLRGSLEARVTIQLVITVSGHSINTLQKDNAVPASEELASDPFTQTTPLPPAITPSASSLVYVGRPTLQTIPDVKIAKSSEGLTQPQPQFGDHTDRLAENGAFDGNTMATGLTSVVSQLEKIINDVNLQDDVSENHIPVLVCSSN